MMELDEREMEVVHVKRLQLEPVGLNGQCLVNMMQLQLGNIAMQKCCFLSFNILKN